MHYKEVIKELGVTLMFSEAEMNSPGHYLPNVTLGDSEGLIVLKSSLSEQQEEQVALHELGHKIDGRILSRLSPSQVHIANEGKANRYMIKHQLEDWLVGFDGDYTHAKTEAFLSWADLDPAKYYHAAHQELSDAILGNA